MDASTDSAEAATFAFLMRGVVYGANGVNAEHALELINKRVTEMKQYLRRVSLPEIESQTVFSLANGVNEDFRRQKALKVYSIGDEAWSGIETVEYWFVDRDGVWYWLEYSSHGRQVYLCVVDASHLVDRFVNTSVDGLLPLYVLGSIDRSFTKLFSAAAERSRQLAKDLDKVLSELSSGGPRPIQVLPPRTT
jgi:hypothetical protein